MAAEYLDTKEALRQLDLYFDAESMRASLLYGDRAVHWEEACARVFRRLRAVLKSTADNHRDETTQQLTGQALGVLGDMADVPPLVVERGLRPETAGHLLANLTRTNVYLVRLRLRLREISNVALERSLQDALDDLAWPMARLAGHVNALTAVYDLLMVRPAYRVLEHWLFAAPIPPEQDEESVEAE